MKFISGIQKINWLKIMKFSCTQLIMALAFAGMSYARPGEAQVNMQQRVNLNMHHATIASVLHRLEKLTDVKFVYSLNRVPVTQRVDIDVTNARLDSILAEVLIKNGIGYEVVSNRIVLTPGIAPQMAPITGITIRPDLHVQLQDVEVRGRVTDENGNPLAGVTIQVKGTNIGTTTDNQGAYLIHPLSGNDTLVFSFIGYERQEIPIAGRTTINVQLHSTAMGLNQIVVVGYGTQKKKDITASISSINTEDIQDVHSGATISTLLAGKLSGLSFRQSEGRPGSSASIQIRNMGTPLFVIDGVVKDEGQFNNISPNDIESITILKDASAAAIYGVRAANGVVVVTTKKGALNTPTRLKIDAYTGWQNLTRVHKVLSSGYLWMLYAAEAQMNEFGSTSITQDELAKWKAGTDYGYQSFDWTKFIIRKNAPQTSVNVNVSGGSDKANYYFSVTRLNQDAVFREYNFNRTNLQSNIDTKIGKRFTAGIEINGRIEERVNPGIPGVDDYWEPLFAQLRNRPTEHPFANNNPQYLNDIGHNADNAGLWTYQRSGKWQQDWRVLQTNFHIDYNTPLKGLDARIFYSYYYANQYLTNHEYTYDAYTYNPVDSTYTRTGGSTNPWQERGQELIYEWDLQGQINYNRSFGMHNIGATFVTERYYRRDLYNWLHDVPPVNQLDIIRFNSMDTYNDQDNSQARVGYIGRITYNYKNRYYIELSGRRDGSWRWPPEHRWGFFPSASIGWRLTDEPFFKNLFKIGNVINDLKIRASYGQLGDDNVNLDPFAYIPGYNYGVGLVILDGNAITTSRDRGQPVTNITWLKSNITDIGLDFVILDKLSGSFDYFYRKRTGLLASRYDIVIPSELGYSLPQENLNSDAQLGGEVSLSYITDLGKVHFEVNGNLSYSRGKFLHSYKPVWGNSWDHYRNSQEDRWTGIFWGYQVIGQFQSQDQINKYPVNEDGQGNTTLLPGDFIYKDQNGDGVINEYDMRPIGYNVGGQPDINGGLNISLKWKGIDFIVDFSAGGMYSYNVNWEHRWPFQNGGNLLTYFLDRWHRENPFDLNSPWIPGKFPPLRFNDPQHNDYNKNSDWWLVNVKYIRLRTMEIGYSLPKKLLQKVNIESFRLYFNTYNLFSIDNLKTFGIDPEIVWDNGLQYPQSKFVNIGFNLTF